MRNLGFCTFYNFVRRARKVLKIPHIAKPKNDAPPFGGTSGEGFPRKESVKHCVYSGIEKFTFTHVWMNR